MGMTCNNYIAPVGKYLNDIGHVTDVIVSLENSEVKATMNAQTNTQVLKDALLEKHTLTEAIFIENAIIIVMASIMLIF